MRYDSEVAKKLVTGGWNNNNMDLKDLIHETHKLLGKINYERCQTAMRKNNGSIPLTSLDAFQIQFQHIKAHKDLDLGNNWVDACAKEGAEGYTNDRPSAHPNKSIEQHLQAHVPRIAQRRETHSENQSFLVEQYLQIELDPIDTDFLVDNDEIHWRLHSST